LNSGSLKRRSLGLEHKSTEKEVAKIFRRATQRGAPLAT